MSMPTSGSPSDLAQILSRLVEFPTYEDGGMRRCAEFLSGEMKRLGFRVEVDKLNNVFGERDFEGGNGSFLINSHFDTVPSTPRWTRDPLHASLEGDRLYGLGASDDKASVASILHVLAGLRSSRFRKLEVLFSNYEDSSSILDGESWLGTPYFLSHHRLNSESGLNVEGTVEDDRVMVSLGCGGRVGFTVTTIGKEAHSSDPRRGRNAIYDMMRVIEELRRLPPAQMTLDGHEAYTELNVSKIQGGIAMNIVPGECEITCERRVLPNEEWAVVKKQVERALGNVKDVEFKVRYMKPQQSYLILRNHPTVTLAKESVERALGYTPKFKVESGRTDSTYLNEAGIKTVIIGPGEVAHIADEYVNVKRVEEFSRVLTHILSRED
jgi:acetylornithine deacetylase/succinyl-diaminopimelate desuccinylase-like protein